MNDFQLAALKKRIGTVRTPITDSELLSLIARMDAAEKVIDGSTHIEVDYPERDCQGCKNMKAWRKASGKSDGEVGK